MTEEDDAAVGCDLGPIAGDLRRGPRRWTGNVVVGGLGVVEVAERDVTVQRASPADLVVGGREEPGAVSHSTRADGTEVEALQSVDPPVPVPKAIPPISVAP